MINLYELKVLDRLSNMVFKIPNFTKITNTSDTEYLKYSIAVDCGYSVEDSEIGYMDKIYDIFRKSVGTTYETTEFKYTIQDFKSFIATPSLDGEILDDIDSNLILNLNLLHIMIHDKINDKYKFYLIPFIINKSLAYTIKNAFRLLDPPTLDLKLDDIVELVDFEKIAFADKECSIVEHICLNQNLDIRDSDIKMGMTYYSIGDLYHVINIEEIENEDNSPVKEAIYSSKFQPVYTKMRDPNADRYVPLINIESTETFKIDEYAAYGDGNLVMSRMMTDAKDGELILVLNTCIQGYKNYDFEELSSDEMMYKGSIFKRELEITKSESNTLVKEYKYLRDTSFESFTIHVNGLAIINGNKYSEMYKSSESVAEKVKDGVKNSLKDIALGVKNKITKAKMDLYFSSLNKHISTLIGTGALLTGNFGIGIAVFLYKAIKKLFITTPLGENMAIDHLKKMSLKMDDILEELEDSLSHAESDRRYYDSKRIKKSIIYYKRIKDMLEKKMIDVRTMKVGLGGDGI